MDDALNALNTLFFVNDNQKKKEANKWLEQFQQTTEAWVLADKLLNSADRPEAQIFGAQTIRRKIVSDCSQLDANTQASLRDSLLNLLQNRFSSGPLIIITQLCLGLAGLALQMDTWQHPFEDVVQVFSRDPALFPVLLEFLSVLPEEIRYNSRIPVPESKVEFFHRRMDELLTNKGPETLQLLLGFLQAKPSDLALAEKVLKCLLSWIKTNDIGIKELQSSPIVAVTFQALQSDDLFDTATDVVVEIIHECSRSLDKCLPFIQSLCPLLGGLLPLIQQCNQHPDEFEDKQRGLTRIFAEAGEIFLPLILQSLDNFRDLMNGIVGCSSFSDLEVVPILFNFWMDLTSRLSDKSGEQIKPLFVDYYRQLSAGMIKHLRYPDEEMTAKAKDGFREFRHSVGDVLKDCCMILGEQEMLSLPFRLISEYMAGNPAANPESWRDIEALLFALRAIGSEVLPTENTVLPQILSYLPSLKYHPKVRYGVTLVIGRYSEWTKHHPELISSQLAYISEGFSEAEIAPASALALKFLCESCGPLMVTYLKDLHVFYFEAMSRLKRAECLDLTEAMAYILNAVPVAELSPALQLFLHPSVQRLHHLGSTGGAFNEPAAVMEAEDILGRMAQFFKIIIPKDVSPAVQHPCITILDQILPVVDKVLLNANNLVVEEAACRLYKTCIISYNQHFAVLVPRMVQTFVRQFPINHCPGFPWVGSHVVRSYGTPNQATIDPAIVNAIRFLSESLIQQTASFLTTPDLYDDNFDLVEDFFRIVLAMLHSSFNSLIYANYLRGIIQLALIGFKSVRVESLESTIFFIRDLLGRPPNQYPESLKSYHQIINESCPHLINEIVGGVVGISTRQPFPGSLYQAISATSLYLGDAAGVDNVLTLIANALQSLHVAYPDRLSAETTANLIESIRAGFACKRPEKIRFSFAKLSSVFYGRAITAHRQPSMDATEDD